MWREPTLYVRGVGTSLPSNDFPELVVRLRSFCLVDGAYLLSMMPMTVNKGIRSVAFDSDEL